MGKEVVVFSNGRDYIEATFTDILDDEVFYELYDMSRPHGRQCFISKISMHLEMGRSPPGSAPAVRIGMDGKSGFGDWL